METNIDYKKIAEYAVFKKLIEKYPNRILSVVSDTFDLWAVCTEYLPALKAKIMARQGKLVIRPDSGDPVDILCGWEGCTHHFLRERLEDGSYKMVDPNTSISTIISEAEYKGVIELLWETFGGTMTAKGYKLLDEHIGAIYGDSITMTRATEICERLKTKGFASINWVSGIGSYSYQNNTRDTFGFAMKATFGIVTENGLIEEREIFKDPITDNGMKKSAKGLLVVYKDEYTGDLYMIDQCSLEEERKGELETVFLNSKLIKDQTLSEIRNRLNKYSDKFNPELI